MLFSSEVICLLRPRAFLKENYYVRRFCSWFIKHPASESRLAILLKFWLRCVYTAAWQESRLSKVRIFIFQIERRDEMSLQPSATISAIRSQVRKKCLLPKSAWSAPIFFQAADTTRYHNWHFSAFWVRLGGRFERREAALSFRRRSWKGANDTLDWEKYSDITLISESELRIVGGKGGISLFWCVTPK